MVLVLLPPSQFVQSPY